MLHYHKNLKDFSRTLRTNMTDAEKLLWTKLRAQQLKGFHFYRQKPVDGFIVDFYCPRANLVIELDGGQHYSESGMRKDQIRDDVLERSGLKVLRFSDREVFERFDAVMEKIWSCL